MEEYITVDEAIAANDRLFGVMFLVFVAYAVLVLLAVMLYEKRRNRIAAENAEVMEKEVEKRIRREYEKKRKSTYTFRLWADTKRKLDTTEKELAETAAERDDYKKQLEDLKQTAAACPAYGTVGKRGNFEP